MALRHTLLGLLILQPRTGYALHKRLEEATFLLEAASLRRIYPTLKRLADEGLVVYEVEPQEGRPARKVYCVTEEGVTEFLQWLRAPADPGLTSSASLPVSSSMACWIATRSWSACRTPKSRPKASARACGRWRWRRRPARTACPSTRGGPGHLGHDGRLCAEARRGARGVARTGDCAGAGRVLGLGTIVHV